jgi:hypothetical protein
MIEPLMAYFKQEHVMPKVGSSSSSKEDLEKMAAAANL